jgi:hypothetical protein
MQQEQEWAFYSFFFFNKQKKKYYVNGKLGPSIFINLNTVKLFNLSLVIEMH